MTWTATLPSARALSYTAAVLKSMVLENTFEPAVATPTDKRGFVMPKFWGVVRLRCPHMVSGGMGRTARPPARLVPCFQHPAHPLRLKTQTVASSIQPGIQTMTTPHRAPIVAPTFYTPTHDEARAHAALEAANCAALARWYSARGNVKAARRKAVQLLAALAVLEGVQHA